MTKCGSPLYIAPEVFTGSYNEAIDVYAFGLILYDLFVRERPMLDEFRRRGQYNFYQAVRTGTCVECRSVTMSAAEGRAR